MKNEQEILIEENIKLAYYMARKWAKNLKPQPQKLTFDEIVSDCMLGLIKAAKAFDKKRGITFATFATRVMDNQILMTLRKSKKQMKEDYISFYQKTDPGSGRTYDAWEAIQSQIISSNNIDDWINLEAIIAAVGKLQTKEKEMLKMKMDGMKQTKIGEIKGFSQSYVSRILKRAEERIGNELKKAQ